MLALDYLKSLPRSWLPLSVERGCKPASNSDLFRWLRNKAVVINGDTPDPKSEITFTIEEFIFFPKGRSRTTVIKEE